MHEKCTNCTRHGKNCLAYVMTLTTPEMLAWCKMRKKDLRLTNAQIAEKSNTPKGTVDRLFAKDSDFTDVRYATVRPIIILLSGSTAEELACVDQQEDNQLLERIRHLEEENAHLEKENAQLREMTQHVRTDLHEEIDYLKQLNKNKVTALTIVSGLLLVALTLIIIALIIDRTDTSRGFFWLESMSHLFSMNQTIL